MKRATNRGMARAAPLAALSLLLTTGAAEADPGDGLYGRLDGDVDLSLAAGGAVAHDGPVAVALVRALFLGTAGAYATYTDALDAPRDVRRSLSLGAEVRPLLLPRFGTDRERGPALLDLTIDSIAFGLGAYSFATRDAGFSRTPGLELTTGFDVPLGVDATGLWLGVRGAARWRPSDFAGEAPGAGERGGLLLLTLGWHQVVAAHLVDAGDRLPRER